MTDTEHNNESALLPTQALPIGWRLEHYATLGSTNDLMRVRARAGEAEGLVIVADRQTAGRGRSGRSWIAPPGSSLLMSLLCRPTWLAPNQAYLLTMLAGIALCDAIEQVAPIQAALKWPNDLLLSSADGRLRKAAGLLCELELRGHTIASVVIGIGVNLSWQPSGLVDGRDLGQTATSLWLAAGRAIARPVLLEALLRQIAHELALLQAGQQAALFTRWQARLATIGQLVTLRLADRTVMGTAEGVDTTGALLVRDPSGVLHRISAGDVEA